MLQLNPNFLCGVTRFADKVRHESRVVIPISLMEYDEIIWAIVDTGATYSIIAPNLAQDLGMHPETCQYETTLMTKWGRIKGQLCRIPVRIDTLKIEGQETTGIEFEPNFFIPDFSEPWEDDLHFIGVHNFLFNIRVAIDPEDNLFYFGGPI